MLHQPILGSFPDLAGKVAVVTGASRGLGAASARALAASGVAVALIGRDADALQTVADSICDAGAGRATAVRADCTEPGDLTHARELVASELGAPEILVAFAGGGGWPVDSIDETGEHFRSVVDGNLLATFLTVQAFLPDLIGSSGSIVTMSSESGRQPTRSSAAYAAAKAGISALSGYLAAELAPSGVRVNCLAPSTIATEAMIARTPEDIVRRITATFPGGRLGQLDDVASAVLFLASSASAWITGTTLDIAGGKLVTL